MKATEQYFPVVLFIMLYKVILTFESVDEILKLTIQMKATEQNFPVVLFLQGGSKLSCSNSLCGAVCFSIYRYFLFWLPTSASVGLP